MSSLSVGRAHDIVLGLKAIEAQDAKLSGQTRVHIAVIINQLSAVTTGYERIREELKVKVIGKDADGRPNPITPQIDALFSIGNVEMREVDSGFKPDAVKALRRLTTADLNLDENPKITGSLLQMIEPVLKDLG